MRQDGIKLQPGIKSIYVTLDDAKPGYEHNFTLRYILHDGTFGLPITAMFSFGIYMHV